MKAPQGVALKLALFIRNAKFCFPHFLLQNIVSLLILLSRGTCLTLMKQNSMLLNLYFVGEAHASPLARKLNFVVIVYNVMCLWTIFLCLFNRLCVIIAWKDTSLYRLHKLVIMTY